MLGEIKKKYKDLIFLRKTNQHIYSRTNNNMLVGPVIKLKVGLV